MSLDINFKAILSILHDLNSLSRVHPHFIKEILLSCNNLISIQKQLLNLFINAFDLFLRYNICKCLYFLMSKS